MRIHMPGMDMTLEAAPGLSTHQLKFVMGAAAVASWPEARVNVSGANGPCHRHPSEQARVAGLGAVVAGSLGALQRSMRAIVVGSPLKSDGTGQGTLAAVDKDKVGAIGMEAERQRRRSSSTHYVVCYGFRSASRVGGADHWNHSHLARSSSLHRGGQRQPSAMPFPDSYTSLNTNQLLTNSFPFAAAPEGYLADKVLPPVPVQKESAAYWVYDKTPMDSPDSKRAPQLQYQPHRLERDDRDVSGTNSTGLEGEIDDEERKNAASPLDLDVDATEIVTDMVLNNREKRVADLVLSTGTITQNIRWPAAISGAITPNRSAR